MVTFFRNENLIISLFITVAFVYDVWGCTCTMARVQRSENNFVELVLSSYLHVGSRGDLRSSDFKANNFTILPAREPHCFPQLHFINLCNPKRNSTVLVSAHSRMFLWIESDRLQDDLCWDRILRGQWWVGVYPQKL